MAIMAVWWEPSRRHMGCHVSCAPLSQLPAHLSTLQLFLPHALLLPEASAHPLPLRLSPDRCRSAGRQHRRLPLSRLCRASHPPALAAWHGLNKRRYRCTRLIQTKR